MREHSYIFVRWNHVLADEPVELWSELDPARFEVRKVEVWADGRVGYAARGEQAGGTALGTEAVPPLNVIAADAEFRPESITHEAFEAKWTMRRG